MRGRARVERRWRGGARVEEMGPGDVNSSGARALHRADRDAPTEALILFTTAPVAGDTLANWLGGNPVSLLMDDLGVGEGRHHRSVA